MQLGFLQLPELPEMTAVFIQYEEMLYRKPIRLVRGAFMVQTDKQELAEIVCQSLML
jgi:hypothetical protein